jgi:hypothetical protein
MFFCYLYTFRGSMAWFLLVHLDDQISKRICTIRNLLLLDALCNWGSLIPKLEPRATKMGKVKYWTRHFLLSTLYISSWFMFMMQWGWCLGGVHGFIIYFSKSILEYCIHFQLYLSHYTFRGRLWVILFIGTWLDAPPNSLKDSNVSSQMKTTKGVRVCSLIHNISKIKGVCWSFEMYD